MSDLTHLNAEGEAHMVDISNKTDSLRTARAIAHINMSAEAFDAMQSGNAKKGDVLGTARLAGIMAAKKCADFIPLCHPLALSKVEIHFIPNAKKCSLGIESMVKTTGKTGVEMEALTAVSIAALTIYDMLKAIDKSMQIEGIELKEKTGGKSGDYKK